MIDVSVIIPIYNVDKYLDRCLTSITNQTLTNIEIICINDNSTDNSVKILDKFARKDNRIKIITNKKNKGLSTCRNLGIKAASAPYVMFCDSDDQYELTMCEKMLSSVKNNNSDIAVCGVNVIYESHQETNSVDNQYFSNGIFNGTYIVDDKIISSVTNVVAWNKIYKTEILKKFDIYFPDGLLFESYPFWGAYISIAKKITFISDKLYVYTRRDGSIMSATISKKNDRAIDYVKSCLSFEEWLQNHNLWDAKKWFFWQMLAFCTSAAISYAPDKEVIKEIYKLTDNIFNKHKIGCKLGFNTSRCLKLIKKHKLKMDKKDNKLFSSSYSLTYTTYYLFNIPLLKIKYGVTKTNWKFLNILSIFKIKNTPNVLTYYFLNIPLLKISRKKHYTKYKLFRFIPVFFKYNNLSGKYVMLLNLLLFFIIDPLDRMHLINLILKKKITPKLSNENFMSLDIDNTNLLSELKKLGKFTYIGNPGNLGDCLIAKATYDFFDENNLQYSIYKGGRIKNLVYGGGGIWFKDIYATSYKKTLKLMNKAKKIVILPSSVWDCDDLVNILDERFVVFCREKQSFEYLISKKTKAKIILDHDMALRTKITALNEPFYVDPEKASLLIRMKPILKRITKEARFLRNDAEKANQYQSHYDLSSAFGSRIMSKEDVTFATNLMLAVVDLYSTIITDRLHVAIAAALMSKEVYMLDNSYKKLSTVYNHSLAQHKNIHLCDHFPKELKQGSIATSNFDNILKEL